eukprot:UN06783
MSTNENEVQINTKIESQMLNRPIRLDETRNDQGNFQTPPLV